MLVPSKAWFLPSPAPGGVQFVNLGSTEEDAFEAGKASTPYWIANKIAKVDFILMNLKN